MRVLPFSAWTRLRGPVEDGGVGWEEEEGGGGEVVEGLEVRGEEEEVDLEASLRDSFSWRRFWRRFKGGCCPPVSSCWGGLEVVGSGIVVLLLPAVSIPGIPLIPLSSPHADFRAWRIYRSTNSR